MVIAENILIITPMPSVKANPFTKLVPNQYKIIEVIILEALESRIDIQARENPSSTAAPRFRPARSSSLIRSNIRIFASTAIPMERINPAMPAAVRVTPRSLNMRSVSAV